MSLAIFVWVRVDVAYQRIETQKTDMYNDFEPHYHKPDPDPHRPSLLWMAWGLVNIIFLAAMAGVVWVIAPYLAMVMPTLDLVLVTLLIVAPAFGAGFIDGRSRSVVVWTVLCWAVLFVSLSSTEDYGFGVRYSLKNWHPGPGSGFAVFYSTIGAAAYGVVMAVLFAIGRAIKLGRDRVDAWAEDDGLPNPPA